MRQRLIVILAAVSTGGLLAGGCSSTTGRAPTATEVPTATTGPAATATRTPTPVVSSTPTSAGAACMNNLDLETGATSPWSVTSTGSGWTLVAATPGVDPNSGGALNAVLAGNFALDLYSGTGSTPLWTSDASNAIAAWGGGALTVQVAAVLWNGHPSDPNNSRFGVEIFANGSSVYQQTTLAHDSSLLAGASGYTYSPWTPISAGTLAPGTNVVVTVRAGGCAYGGHTVHTYADCQ